MTDRQRLIPLLISLALVAACGMQKTEVPASAKSESTTMPVLDHLMKTYKVPAGHEKSVARLLEETSYPISVVSANGAQTQFVRLNPQFTGDGYFVLAAPKRLHDGVEELLKVITQTKPSAGPPSVRVSYWLVLGWPAEEMQIDPALQGITEAIEPLSKLGVMRFQLLESLSLLALDGEEGVASGRLTTVKNTASIEGDAIELRLEIQALGGGKQPSIIETAVNLKPGQYAVLGQAGYTPEPTGLNKVGEASPVLFYLAMAQPLD